MSVRALVVLARMALMIWLGAVDERLKSKIKDLVLLGLENIKYVGLRRDSLLPWSSKKKATNKGRILKGYKTGRERIFLTRDFLSLVL
jgi:hypothetical protein